MPPTPGAVANRRLLTYILGVAGFLVFVIMLSTSNPAAPAPGHPLSYSNTPIHHVTVADETLKGGAIMPKLGNETLKAELGRASWKLFHTTLARFPDKPTADEQTALFSYIHLFARLYPCGECAGHFRQILDQYPPQTSSRSKAAVWGCYVHNVVNKSLKKEEFDCANIGDFYDCGCAEDEDEAAGKSAKGKGKPEDAITTVSGSGKKGHELKLEREGTMLGG